MAKKIIEVLTDTEGNLWVGHALKDGSPSADSRMLSGTEIVSIFSHFLAQQCEAQQRDDIVFLGEGKKPFLYAKFLNIKKDES